MPLAGMLWVLFFFSEPWTVRHLNRHFNFVGAYVGAFDRLKSPCFNLKHF